MFLENLWFLRFKWCNVGRREKIQSSRSPNDIFIIFNVISINMRTIQEIMAECDGLEKKGANEWQATNQLTDEEFRTWYIQDNRRWWEKYRRYHNGLPCSKCRSEIKSPEQLGSWGGTMYHISCMIDELFLRQLDGDYKLLYKRLARVFS